MTALPEQTMPGNEWHVLMYMCYCCIRAIRVLESRLAMISLTAGLGRQCLGAVWQRRSVASATAIAPWQPHLPGAPELCRSCCVGSFTEHLDGHISLTSISRWKYARNAKSHSVHLGGGLRPGAQRADYVPPALPHLRDPHQAALVHAPRHAAALLSAVRALPPAVRL